MFLNVHRTVTIFNILRLLCRVQAAQYRREILAVKMLRRVKTKEIAYLEEHIERRNTQEIQAMAKDIEAMEKREPFEKAVKLLQTNQSIELLRSKFMLAEGDRLELNRKRKIPYNKTREFPAILQFSNVKHRQLALQYISGRFPQVSTTSMTEKFGNRVREYMNSTKTKNRQPKKR